MVLINRMFKSGKDILRLSVGESQQVGIFNPKSSSCLYSTTISSRRCVGCSSYLSTISSRRFVGCGSYSSTISSRPCVGGSNYFSTICSHPCVGGSPSFSIIKGFLSLFTKSSKDLVNTLSDNVDAIMMNPELLPAAKVTSLKDLVERLSLGQIIELMNAYWKKDSSSSSSRHSCELFIELLNAYWNKVSPSSSFGTALDGLVDATLLDNTNEPIKGIAIFHFVIRYKGILLDSKTDPNNEDEIKFKFDNKGMQITVNVSEKEHKEHLKVFVVDDTVRVLSTAKTETGQILEVIELPQLITYDPDQVTGSIIEGGDLKISFPYSEEEKNVPSSFQINLV